MKFKSCSLMELDGETIKHAEWAEKEEDEIYLFLTDGSEYIIKLGDQEDEIIFVQCEDD